jgi:MoaA/NifB/PqqE/SkfB family radical SAM enzyme
MPDSGPARSKTINYDVLQSTIQQANNLSFKAIAFTGGEPFSRPAVLKFALSITNKFNMLASVMTNGLWAKTPIWASKTLKEIGPIWHLGISAGPQHQRFVPIDNVKNAIIAASDLGISCSIRLSYTKNSLQEERNLLSDLSEVRSLFSFERQPIQPFGRGAKEIPREELSSEHTTNSPCLSADVHAVDSDGNITACCGASIGVSKNNRLNLGDIKTNSLEQIIEKSKQNSILHAMRVWGPGRLLEIINEYSNNIGQILPDIKTNHICELCISLTTIEEYKLIIDDLANNPDFLRKLALSRMLELGEI